MRCQPCCIYAYLCWGVIDTEAPPQASYVGSAHNTNVHRDKTDTYSCHQNCDTVDRYADERELKNEAEKCGGCGQREQKRQEREGD